MPLKLTKNDVSGVVSMPPTPCKDGAGGWNVTDSIDYDKVPKMLDLLLESGAKTFAFCGTTGENAALLWEEKRSYIAAAAKHINHRVPIFAGSTNLGTKDVIRQVRAFKDVGVEGVFLGLPLWQTPTLENSIQYYADISEAVPDMAIMVYSNSSFFKSNFPVEFWEGMAKKAPTVICNKITYGIDHIVDDLRVAGDKINFIPGGVGIVEADKKAPGRFTALWSTGYALEPFTALVNALHKRDMAKVEEVEKDIKSVSPLTPPGGFGGDPTLKGWMKAGSSGFAHYNAQIHKHEWHITGQLGYLDLGPMRAPYTDLPDDYKKFAEAHTRGWMEMRKKYIGVKAG